MVRNATVTACIVTWNSAKTIVGCIETLKNQTYQEIELVVVDNASRDHSVEIAQECFPSARVIRNDDNTGFCRAQNTGIGVSEGEYFMPLNPDIQMSPTFVETLVEAMNQESHIGIVTGKLYLPECDLKTGVHLIDGAGLFIDKARRQYLRGHGEPDYGQYDKMDYVFGACGAAPLYRRTMLEDIKIDSEYFDNSFFAHKEDLDLSWRAQLLGWKAAYAPHALAYHDRKFRPKRRSMMLPEIRMHAVKNRYLAIVKNDMIENLGRHIFWIMFYDLKILGYISAFERSSLKGIAAFFHILPDALKKRQAIMQRRRSSAEYMRQFLG